METIAVPVWGRFCRRAEIGVALHCRHLRPRAKRQKLLQDWTKPRRCKLGLEQYCFSSVWRQVEEI